MPFRIKELLEFAAASEAVDFATARRSLPIAFLMEKHGFSVQEDGQRCLALCPFHDDSRPSLSIFGSDVERFNCFSCSAKGDSIDMLLKFEPELVGPEGKYGKPLFDRIRELITAVIDEGWTGPSGLKERPPFDIQQATEIVNQAQLDVKYSRIDEFLEWKREQRGTEAWPFTADWLAERWMIGTYGNWLIIPYYSTTGELLAYKRWSDPKDARKAAGGAVFSGHLYGEWRDDDGIKPIFMCEGESDTWWADFHLGDDFLVLGLPTGVNSSTAPAAAMAGRSVFLAFDADGDDERGGRHATKIWAEALETAGAFVKIVPIPDGRDLATSEMSPHILVDLARPPVMKPPTIRETPRGYESIDPKSGKVSAISNFVFVPKRGLHGADMSAFEGLLMPGGDPAVIQSSDMRNEAALRQWAAAHRRSFWGSTKDAGMLLASLQADEVYLPSGRLVTVAGLHKGTFVWPGGKIGNEPVVYVPPPSEGHLGEKIKIAPGPWSTDTIHLLRSVHRRNIMDPMLAWLAFAPLRSLAPEFPFLMVTGPKGSGKSETTKAVVYCFSGSKLIQTFTSTPHAIKTSFAATNAFPQIDDEYRPGGRKDSLETVAQLVREAYQMQASRSGGLSGQNWNQVSEVVPSSPTIIAGEDEFQEGSHIDRMVPLHVDENGHNPAAFFTLMEINKQPNGLPYAYIAWLHDKFFTGKIPLTIDVLPDETFPLPVRQQHNLGILRSGWSLLQEFMSDHNDNLDEPDFSGVVFSLKDGNKRTPIEDAIRWCLGEADATHFVLPKGDEIWVQVESFYAYITYPSRAAMFTLMGRVASVRHYMQSRLNARIDYIGEKEYCVFHKSKIARD